MIFWRYRAHLETELVKQELLLKFVIADKEKIIIRQDEEIKLLRAECERYKLLLFAGLRTRTIDQKQRPFNSGAGGGEIPTTAWETTVNEHMARMDKEAKEKANGVPQQVGTGVHEPASSDASGQNGEPATSSKAAS